MKSTLTRMRLLSAAAIAMFAAGCAQSNGDLNRVQPNVMKKEDLLDGQWFFRNSVTYTPFNTQFTYPGQTGNMEKLVWEVQQGNLVGYRSYPFIVGAESNIDPSSKISGTTATYCNKSGECKGGQKYYGAPVVAFPIESHFDIQRGYNPATGEQTNVISENSSDRVWNQREYIRVNWAANILNKNSGLSFGTIQNAAGGSSTSNWIQPNEKGEDSYDWPTYEYDAKGKLSYFDVTARYMANPDTTYYDGYGDVPLCWFAAGIYDCSSAEIKIRSSVMKVDTNWSRDYEPLQYGNDLMSMFGFFRTERLNWDKKFGLNDSAVIRLANRHRVYESYYKKDANGEPDTTQPLPLADRKVKPVVYYFTRADRMGGEDRYAEFWEPGRKVETDYNRAFSKAMAAAQGKSASEIPQMFFLCNNPVKDGDPASCGKSGFSPKFGDLRYSFVNTVAEPVANGLLGYGPSSNDPETGQIIAGNSNTYLWGVDLIGRELVDLILLLNNEKTATEYISGQDMKDYIAANPVYNVRDIMKQTAPLQSELQGIATRNEETLGAWSRPTDRMNGMIQGLKARGGLQLQTRNEMKAAADALATNPQMEAAVLDNAEVQADLVNLLPPYAQERAKNDPSFLRQVSRSVLTDITSSQQWQQRRLDWLSKNNITMAEFYDRTLMGEANEKQNIRETRIAAYKSSGSPKCKDVNVCTDEEAKTLANDDIAKLFRQQIWLATTLHELGHTFNLRHNFQGSFDAVNYFDQYWDIKKPTLTMKQGGIDKLPRTPNDMKTAADGTALQLTSKMYDYEYSSIMDYAGKRNGDWQGIGKYDEAAIMFAYSGTTTPGYVEVFKGARKDSKQFPGTDGANMTISGAGGDLPIVNATATNPNVYNYTERFHYTTIPMHFGEGADTAAIINDGIAKLKNRELAKWSDVKADEDRVRAALIADPTLAGDPDRAASQLGNVRLRVPYMFCSDESADGPVLSCYRFDRGPDYYEQTRTRLEDYWNYYYDSHFRRDKLFFSGNSAINSAYGTFYNVANSYKHWVYRFYKQGDKNQEIVNSYKADALIQDYWTMGVLDGVNQHLNVMSVPPYGMFMFRPKGALSARWDLLSEGVDYEDLNADGQAALAAYAKNRYGATDFVVVPRGQGRRMYSRYDFKSGFGFFNRMSEAGHYNDQLGAMFAAVLPQFDVQGVDQQADQNRYSIPYYQTFKPEFTDTFGSLWSQDEDKVRPVLYRTLDNAGTLTSIPKIAQRRFVNGANLFAGFEYPKATPAQCTTPLVPGCIKTTQNLAPANIQVTYTSRIYALYLGEALFKANYDLDYSKVNQIIKIGGNESFSVTPGFHTYEVEDTVTGAKYAAIEADGAGPDSTPAIRAVRLSKIYLEMVRDPARCPLDNYLVILGVTCLPADQANNPAILEERRKYWLESYQDALRDLDLMRDFYRAFGKAF